MANSNLASGSRNGKSFLRTFVFALLPHILEATSTIGQKALTETALACATAANWATSDVGVTDNIVQKFIGSQNVILIILEDSTCSTDDIVGCAKKHDKELIKAGPRAIGGLILAVITLIIWILMWPCACCRCWRRCKCWCCFKESAEPRNLGGGKKLIYTVYSVVLLAGVVVTLVFALLMRNQLYAGATGAMCEVFQFANDTINGYTPTGSGQSFIGLEPAVAQLNSLGSLLDSTGPFLTNVTSIITNTEELEYALTDFTGTLALMNDMLGDPTNNKVGNYSCYFCTVCCTGTENQGTSLVGAVVNFLSSSSASALQSVRTQISNELTGPALTDLQSQFNSAMDPINNVVELMSNTLGSSIIDHREVASNYLRYVSYGALAITLVVALPALLLLMTTIAGIWCSKRSTFIDPDIKPQNPCHASSAWCCTCLYSLAVFIIAGVVLLLAYVEGSACLVMDNIGEDIDGFTHWFGDNSDSINQSVSVVQACFPTNSSGDLLGSITTNGVTLSSTLDVNSRINGQFDVLTETLLNATTSSNISDNSDFQQILMAIEAIGPVFAINDNTISQLQNANDFLPTEADGNLTDIEVTTLISDGFLSVPQCSDYTADITGLSQSVLEQLGSLVTVNSTVMNIAGTNTYMTQLSGNSIDTGVATCPDLASSPATQRLQPWGNILNLRREVITKADYKCNTATTAKDPSTGTYVTTQTTAMCTFDEFVAYIAAFGPLLEAKAAAVDAAKDTTIVKINTDLRSLVNTYFIAVLEELIDGLNCQFISVRWNQFIDAFCWTHVAGEVAIAFCWIAFGLICWLAALLEFCVWRRLKDNKCLWIDLKKNGYSKQ